MDITSYIYQLNLDRAKLKKDLADAEKMVIDAKNRMNKSLSFTNRMTIDTKSLANDLAAAIRTSSQGLIRNGNTPATGFKQISGTATADALLLSVIRQQTTSTEELKRIAEYIKTASEKSSAPKEKMSPEDYETKVDEFKNSLSDATKALKEEKARLQELVNKTPETAILDVLNSPISKMREDVKTKQDEVRKAKTAFRTQFPEAYYQYEEEQNKPKTKTPNFRFRAMNAFGKETVGEVDATNKQEAEVKIRAMKLFPLEIKKIETATAQVNTKLPAFSYWTNKVGNGLSGAIGGVQKFITSFASIQNLLAGLAVYKLSSWVKDLVKLSSATDPKLAASMERTNVAMYGLKATMGETIAKTANLSEWLDQFDQSSESLADRLDPLSKALGYLLDFVLTGVDVFVAFGVTLANTFGLVAGAGQRLGGTLQILFGTIMEFVGKIPGLGKVSTLGKEEQKAGLRNANRGGEKMDNAFVNTGKAWKDTVTQKMTREELDAYLKKNHGVSLEAMEKNRKVRNKGLLTANPEISMTAGESIGGIVTPKLGNAVAASGAGVQQVAALDPLERIANSTEQMVAKTAELIHVAKTTGGLA